MDAISESFLIPREQFPSWAFLTAFPRQEVLPGTEKALQRHFFFWARNGIYYALKALQISSRAHLLLPAYLCTAAVEPCLSFGAEVEFYSIQRNGEPNFAEVEAKINSETEAVLAVHYFGFPQRILEFRALCDRHGLALIEDCAHVLEGQVDGRWLGTIGDASVFSWRKFLSVYDGGELRLIRAVQPLEVEWQRETLLFSGKVAKCLLDLKLEQSRNASARMLRYGMESARKAWRRASAAPPDQPLVSLDSNRASFDPALLNQPMSRVSRWLFRHADFPAIVAARRLNFLFLHERLLPVRGITPLHRDLPPQVCPWVYPVFFDGLPNAHLLLRKEGIPAVTWSGVRPSGVDATAFPDADFLYENLVFLPVHQNLTREALELIVEKAKKVRQTTDAQKPRGACALD